MSVFVFSFFITLFVFVWFRIRQMGTKQAEMGEGGKEEGKG